MLTTEPQHYTHVYNLKWSILLQYRDDWHAQLWNVNARAGIIFMMCARRYFFQQAYASTRVLHIMDLKQLVKVRNEWDVVQRGKSSSDSPRCWLGNQYIPQPGLNVKN